jgi:hypothetical protein
MKTVEAILASNQIEHESDKCLVRVIGEVLTNPGVPKSELLEASGLTLKADLQLASAMIETVKAVSRPLALGETPITSTTPPQPQPARGSPALAIALLVSLVVLSGTAVAYFNTSAESKGRGARIAELESSLQMQQDLHTKEYATLSAKTTAALSTAGVSAAEFKTATGDYLVKADSLAKEVAEMRAENARLKAELESARKTNAGALPAKS